MIDGAKLQAGGTLNPRKHLYIERPEDSRLLELLEEGEYVNILTSRQMGKSSLVAPASLKLRARGVRTVYIDLASELGTPDTAETYYLGLLGKIIRELKFSFDIVSWWRHSSDETVNQRLLRFFREIVAKHEDNPLVIFLDEIDSTLRLPYTDDLFTALRGMYNERSQVDAYERIVFCLIGVATPNELIKDRRTTAYNVGETLELRDFDAERDDLSPLAKELGGEAVSSYKVLERVLHWTGGHPYLTDRMCLDLALVGAASPHDVDRRVDTTFTKLERLSNEAHFQQILRFLENRLTDNLATLNLYAKILKGARERDQTTLAHAELKLSGLVKRNDEGILVVRNPIYQRLFDRAWVESTKPNQTVARTRFVALAASIALIFAIGGGIAYQTLVVAPGRAGLESREALERMDVLLSRDTSGEGLMVGFSLGATQEILQQAVPLFGAIGTVTSVNLGNTQVSDVSPLSGLTALQRLSLHGTPVSDVGPLSGLTALQGLDLSDTSVSDLAPLSGLTSLGYLDLTGTLVSDVTPLSGLTSLAYLDLEGTLVSDVTPLSGLASLEYLDLGGTNVNREQVDRLKAALTSLGNLKVIISFQIQGGGGGSG